MSAETISPAAILRLLRIQARKCRDGAVEVGLTNAYYRNQYRKAIQPDGNRDVDSDTAYNRSNHDQGNRGCLDSERENGSWRKQRRVLRRSYSQKPSGKIGTEWVKQTKTRHL